MENIPHFGLNPPKFSVGNNVQRFFQRLEAFVAIQHREYTEQQTVNLIANLLCNRSFDYFNSLSPVTKQNYNATKTAIINHYDCTRSVIKIWSLLNNRKQLLNENITDYYDALITIARDIQILPDNLFYLFLNGIHKETKEYLTLLPNSPRQYRTLS